MPVGMFIRSGGSGCSDCDCGAGTVRTVQVRGCNNANAEGSGATVTITGPDPAPDVVCSGTANASGVFTCSLANGTYSYSIGKSRYATATGTITHSGVGTTTVTLTAAAGYVCCGSLCTHPIPTTLFATSAIGGATLTYSASLATGNFSCDPGGSPLPTGIPGYMGCGPLTMAVGTPDEVLTCLNPAGTGSVDAIWIMLCTGIFRIYVPTGVECGTNCDIGGITRRYVLGRPGYGCQVTGPSGAIWPAGSCDGFMPGSFSQSCNPFVRTHGSFTWGNGVRCNLPPGGTVTITE